MGSSTWVDESGSTTAGPLTFLNSVPEERQKEAALLVANVMMLARLAKEFAAAVALFSMFRANADFAGVAARDGVMTVYHFSQCSAAVKAGVKESPELAHRARALKAAIAPFLSRFPTGELQGIRDAVGHRTELTMSVERYKRGAVNGRMFIGNLTGSTYKITNKQKHFELPLDAATCQVLVNTVLRVIEALPELRLGDRIQFNGMAA